MPSVIPTTFDAPKDDFPFPFPFILSSVERDWCSRQANSQAATVYIKRRHLEENMKAMGLESSMDVAERKRFFDYWCCPTIRDRSTIRAELDECFDLRQRMESWRERARPAGPAQKSRLERYAETAQQFYQNAQSETIPTRPCGASGFGYADIPDEQ